MRWPVDEPLLASSKEVYEFVKENVMRLEWPSSTLGRKPKLGNLFASLFGLLTFVAVNGCAESERDRVPPPAVRATASNPGDANRPAPFFQVDSRKELEPINKAFQGYRFTRRDFDNGMKVWQCLELVSQLVHIETTGASVGAVHLNTTLVGSTAFGMDPNEWLRVRDAKSEAVFRELTRAPQFLLQGDNWTITFNVFHRDGRVDQWMVAGSHDPKASIVQLRRAEVARLKPPGTFRWPYMG
jgi:hypothetical protein